MIPIIAEILELMTYVLEDLNSELSLKEDCRIDAGNSRRLREMWEKLQQIKEWVNKD